MSRRVLAQMVARNEADRYLQLVLGTLEREVDAVHVYDDLSSDATMTLAMDCGAVVTRRPAMVPNFTQDESRCRQAAWLAMEEALRPRPGDWILAVDADELLVAPQGMGVAIDAAEAAGAGAIVVPIPEVFALRPGPGGLSTPLVRTDGWWGGLSAPRLAAFEYEGQFAPHRLAGGSMPSYVSAGAQTVANHGVELLHLGYIDMEDRKAKHARYAHLPGHNPKHVASILETPFLQTWEGDPVEVWRGARRPRRHRCG